MNFSKIQKLTKFSTVLVAPLDWGLGHATRCIPIIKQLLELECRVIIAADGAQKKILSEAFPQLEIIFLEGYRIKYSKKSRYFFFTLLTQFPKIFRTILKEQRWLKKVATEYKIDAIISDNRFGLYHSTLPNIYITHQVAVKTGISFLDSLARKIHLSILNKYSHCWIPDFEPITQSLAGQLSHPQTKPDHSTYIGCLSRFEVLENQPKLFDIVAVVSGPEPQRSIFESLLLASLRQLKGKNLLVRGLPAEADDLPGFQTKHLTIKNHLDQYELNRAMMQAEIVLCRSGYTTIMDLLKIKQKAILVPTPGQAEQEYLADYLQNKQIFYSRTQQNFNLPKALQEADEFPYSFPEVNMNLFEDAVTQFVQSL